MKGTQKSKTLRLVLIAHDNLLYGSTRSLISILNNLINYNYELHVIVPEGSEEIHNLINNSIKFHVVKYQYSIFLKEQIMGRLGKFRKYKQKIIGYYNVYRIIKKLQPDLIFTNNSIVNHGIFSSILLKKPHVWQFRESVFKHNEVFGNLSYDFGIRIQKWLYAKSDIRLTNSQSLHNDYQKNFNSESTVIYNGVVSENEILRDAKVLPRELITLTIIGGISKNKGQNVAIQALNLLNKGKNKFKLLLAGDGDISSIKSNFESENLNHILFLGFVKDISQVYSQTNILLICSKYESFGRTVVEAFSYGIPVISSRCGGPEEIISDGEDGSFFNGTPEDLAAKISAIATESEYFKLSKGALKKAEKFTIEKNISQLVTIFESLK